MADTLPLEDYESFCDLAREFNEYVPPERVKSAAPSQSDVKGDRPGDEYNRRANWSEILEPHGWKVDRTSGDVTYWTRPDKKHGVSATTGKCSTEGGGDLLYVFSGNAHPFEPDAAYSKFAALAHLECGGSFPAAAKRLRGEGFGLPNSSIIFPASAQPEPNGMPDDGIQPDHEFATNADLKKYDLGIHWLWEKWFQRATVNLLAAEGGMGKTRFMLDLCRRVHLGLSWPDETPTVQWESQYLAMWVAGDRNHGELVELSEKFGFGERISYSGSKKDPLGGITLNTSADFSTLYRRVKAARPMFLVIDTAGGATGLNMAKQEEARTFFAPLSDMALRLGLCVIVITHLNAAKNTYGKRAEERVRTVTRITAQNREPQTPRRIEVMKSNAVFPLPLGMTLRETGSDYSLTDVPPKPENMPASGGASEDDSPDRGPGSKVRECADWLRERLEGAAVRVSHLRNEAEDAKGFSAKVLYKAKKALNIIEAESEGYKWWSLTAESASAV